MKLILYDRLYLELAEISADHRMKMDKLFTPYNPKYTFEERSGRSTKGISKYIKMYEVVDGLYVLPIGVLCKVLDFLDWYGYKYEIIDKRTEGKDISFEFDDSVILESYQVDVVNALLNSKTCNGLVQAPPGSGKTFLALYYISKIKKKTLIVVHENRLFDQWVQEIKRRGRGKYTLGVFNGSEHTFGDITLVLIQSGYRYKDSYPEFSEYGVVIVDETHHASASTGIFAKFLHNIPAKYKFGLSGTLKRKDGMDFVVEYFLGEKLIEIPESKTKNRVLDFNVQFIDTKVSIDLPWNTRDGKPAYTIKEKNGKKVQVKNYLRLKTHEFLEAITGFKGHNAYPKDISDDDIIAIGLSGAAGVRNRLLIQEIISDIKIGYFPLVLTNRTMHAKFIYVYLKREGYNGVILTGETAENYDIADIRDTNTLNGERIHYIVASEKIASEALDIPYLSSLHLLIPSQNQYKLKQCLGRIRRRASVEKLSPVVKDYVDRESGTLPGEEDYFERSAKIRRYHYSKWKQEYAEA
jgi:superfamily II DNA or RNA helicase